MVSFFLPIVKTQCEHLQLDHNQECNTWKSPYYCLISGSVCHVSRD